MFRVDLGISFIVEACWAYCKVNSLVNSMANNMADHKQKSLISS